MSTVFSNPPSAAVGNRAANADRVDERIVVSTLNGKAAQGWDAYDVWRRLIKEARDRREARNASTEQ